MPPKTAESTLLDEVRELFAGVFRVQPAEISPNLQFGELPQWDSMGHMDLMVALEDRFGVEISAEAISSLVSVPSIVAHLQAKRNA